MRSYTDAVVSSARETALISVINLIPAVALYLVYHIALTDSDGFILLVEGAALMLVGGGLGFAGQAGVRRVSQVLSDLLERRVRGTDPKAHGAIYGSDLEKADIKAAFYMLTGILLFLESVALAIVVTSL